MAIKPCNHCLKLPCDYCQYCMSLLVVTILQKRCTNDLNLKRMDQYIAYCNIIAILKSCNTIIVAVYNYNCNIAILQLLPSPTIGMATWNSSEGLGVKLALLAPLLYPRLFQSCTTWFLPQLVSGQLESSE